MGRILNLVIAFACMIGLAHAQDAPFFESKAAQAILIDAKSGAILYEKDADTAIPPASMSKLVTQAVVFDALKAGRLKLDQEFIVSTDAWKRRRGPRLSCMATVTSSSSIATTRLRSR